MPPPPGTVKIWASRGRHSNIYRPPGGAATLSKTSPIVCRWSGQCPGITHTLAELLWYLKMVILVNIIIFPLFRNETSIIMQKFGSSSQMSDDELKRRAGQENGWVVSVISILALSEKNKHNRANLWKQLADVRYRKVECETGVQWSGNGQYNRKHQ